MSNLRCTLPAPALALGLLAASACDAEPEPQTPGLSLRTEHAWCGRLTVATQGGSFTYNVTPDPEDPDPDDGPLMPHQLADLIHNSDRVFELSFASIVAAEKEQCVEACAEFGQEWSGGACVYESEYDVGKIEFWENEDGTLGAGVEVEAFATPGCACQ